MTNDRKPEPEKGLANDEFFLDEAGNKVSLSEVVGKMLKFTADPNFADGIMSDPQYLDPNAPSEGEVRPVTQYSKDTDYLVLGKTSSKGECYIRPAVARTHSRVVR